MPALPTRTLGRSGLETTRLGLGLAAVGRPAYINLGRDDDLGADRSVEALERRAHDLLDAAYAAGVRYFDAARSYGRAEAFLRVAGSTPAPAGADVTVGSKWGYAYTGDWRVDAETSTRSRTTRVDHAAPPARRDRALLGRPSGRSTRSTRRRSTAAC